ncbi:MAG: hypothetical protein IJP42_05860 [Selenomonadaceae bacterium]|nr:hypothetical protein [Selenomonadaceae bacterium]
MCRCDFSCRISASNLFIATRIHPLEFAKFFLGKLSTIFIVNNVVVAHLL